jgi:hypothetical protein
MEQSGFRPEDERSQRGANYGWQRYIGGPGRVVAAPNRPTELARPSAAEKSCTTSGPNSAIIGRSASV